MKVFYFSLFFFMIIFSLNTLEIEKGRIKVSINEQNGEFAVFASNDLKESRQFHPLYSAQSPATSRITVFLNGEAFVLGDNNTFALAIESTPTGAQAVWTRNSLKLTQKFDFITSVFSGIADGIKISFTCENLSHVLESQVGFRLLLDTDLGKKQDHFLLSTGERINRETQIKNNMPNYVISPSSINKKLGFLFMLAQGNHPPPDRVVFSNWQRLKESVWDFICQEGRSFHFLPYSYNDSAMLVYWNPRRLSPEDHFEIAFMMGMSTARTFVGARTSTGNSLQDILDGLNSLEKNQDQRFEFDIFFFDELLNYMDEMLKTPQNITKKDLQLISEIVEKLKAREIDNSRRDLNH